MRSRCLKFKGALAFCALSTKTLVGHYSVLIPMARSYGSVVQERFPTRMEAEAEWLSHKKTKIRALFRTTARPPPVYCILEGESDIEASQRHGSRGPERKIKESVLFESWCHS